MHSNGLFSKTEVASSIVDLNLIQAREKVVQQNIVLSRNSINYLLNKNPSELPNPVKFRHLSGASMVIGALPLCIIENRPDMQEATEELKAANET